MKKQILSGWIMFLLASPSYAENLITVGSKSFTESYVLGEIFAQIIRQEGEAKIETKKGLHGTGMTFEALRTRDLQIYPEYTGTISTAILKKPQLKTFDEIQVALKKHNLIMSRPLGFNNTYALAMPRALAEKLGISKTSELRKHASKLKTAFNHEFIRRPDGLPGLERHYGFRFAQSQGLEHSLSYEALASGKADIMDVYSTDSKIKKFDLKVLEDDKKFFPIYLGVALAHQDFPTRFPQSWAAIQSLAGKIDDQTMIRMNSQADLEGKSFSSIAKEFLLESNGIVAGTSGATADWNQRINEILFRGKEHVLLVFVSLAIAVLLGLPLGILGSYNPKLGQLILVTTGLSQTIPALALLVFLIAPLGTGTPPALVALIVYGLLPIVRNTYAGLTSQDPKLLESAKVLGLSRCQRLRLIELPLASETIMAGIKTSAVINVGTATLAAMIGAGGFGALIVAGLALNDQTMMMRGAIPAALLALLLHGLFEILDRVFIPKGLRQKDILR